MITAALLISIAVCLVFVVVLVGARGVFRARAAARLRRDLSAYLRDVRAIDHEHATGTFDGLPVTVSVSHAAVTVHIALPHAILPYDELLDRYASDAMQHELARTAAQVEPGDRVRLRLVREAELSDTLGTLGKRLAVVRDVRELRRYVPGELLARIARMRNAADVDAALDALVTIFPDAPETRQAYAAAVARYQDERLAARAASLLGMDLHVRGH